MGCIYIVTCKANGKQYIGQTRSSLKRRQYDYVRTALQAKRAFVSIFHHAIAKHSPQAFEWAVLCNVEPDEYSMLDDLESLAIEM